MHDENSRRRFLKRGAAAVGATPFVSHSVSSHRTRSKTLRIESEGGGLSAYEFTVSGELGQVDSGDRVTGRHAAGNVGPKRGTDTFRYSGVVTGLVLAGPATLYRDDTRVEPSSFSRPAGSLTSDDFDAGSGTDRLRIESDGGGVAVYEFTASGSVRQFDRGDIVDGNRAVGHVGPDRGVDEFAVGGEVTAFALAGPATVSLNGSEVTPSRPSPTVSRGSPKRKITVRPDTSVLFETVVSDYPGDYVSAEWYVDGEWRVGPDLFYGHLGSSSRATFTHRFESPGTYRIRSEVYREGEASREGDEPIDVVEWTVEVGSDGNLPPVVERLEPTAEILRTNYNTTEKVRFEVAATDPDSELDRVVWWIAQADSVHGVSQVEGDYDTARITYDIDPGLPFGAYAIDEHGAISRFRGWNVESE
ncbi:twin-arginine translocation signal domain-containing protein [Halorussus salinisoli]|uniref:twin-arginine translocation signal domain-containing protein n=1 Tax=Halorussus salinisoli TaxID=2558242 RepID=UPI00148577A3|nr:twin-arginine translocation signal domain-containing protein [Halorussus salinisoli]